MSRHISSRLLRSALRSRPASSSAALRPSSRFLAAQPSQSLRATSRSLVTTSRRLAEAVGGASSTDPSDVQVQQLLAEGIQCMANADLEGAQSAYQRSLEIKETPAALYNLALARYQLGQLPQAIEAFEKSLALQPSADAHTNVASAYILSTPPNAYKAIQHLQQALALSPNDGEIYFNMGVIFEASQRYEDALREYNKAQELGIERAAQCIRNVGGKLVEKGRAATGEGASGTPSSGSS